MPSNVAVVLLVLTLVHDLHRHVLCTPLRPRLRGSKAQRLLTPDHQCSAELWNLENRLTQIVHPVDLQGHWVSTECEVHPGPKFVLRDYQFHKTGNFLIRHYEYKDPACTTPVYGFTANGNILHLGKSWAVPGATDTAFSLDRVSVVPYTKPAAKALTQSLRNNCQVEPGKPFDWPWLHEYQDYLVYQAADEEEEPTEPDAVVNAAFDCMHSANFTMTQLNLLRMDEILDANADSADRFFLRHLHFGKAIWDAFNSTYLWPSSFQSPLVDSDQMINCRTCERIVEGNQLSPPRLKSDDALPERSPDESWPPAGLHQLPVIGGVSGDQLDGDWLSSQCESYAHGMYAQRRMSFRTAERVWRLRQRYYDDPLCKQASFTLLADGHFSPAGPSQRLAGAQRMVYKIERVRLAAESKAALHNLRRSGGCGPAHRWRHGRLVDLGRYGGCAPMGIVVPAVTRDVIKVVEDHRRQRRWLLTGDYATVEHSGREFPTSYQSPLTRCAEMTVVVSLDTSQPAATPDQRYGINFLKLQTAASASLGRRPPAGPLFLTAVVLLLLMARAPATALHG